MAELLAIDTSTPVGSIAVGERDRLLAEVSLGVGTRHAEALLPAVRFALAHAQIELNALTGVVVGAGPGSFTGVRIAAATAKGLAHALGLPFYAYSSLLALAASAAQEGRPVCAVLDARRGEVYAACYAFPGLALVDTMLEPVVTDVERLIRGVAAYRPLFVGEGALRYREQLAPVGSVAPVHLGVPRASALLWLAGLDPEAGRVDSAARWEPHYLRASGAERGVRG